MGPVEQRVMRIAVPVPLIREMDSVIIRGLGGYSTRAEFILDAIQERVLEVTGGEVEDSGPPPAADGATAAPPSAQPEVERPSQLGSEAPTTLAVTELDAPRKGFTLESGDNLARPEGRPLFGLHNRDYPSLWALANLATLTQDGPIPVETFYSEVTRGAWKFGEVLRVIEQRTGVKRTALFPTNLEKRKSAEMGFRAFALGDYRPAPDRTFTTSGPLFEWQVVGLTIGDGKEPLIGITKAGWQMLKSVAGMSIDEPHPAAASAYFLDHLRQHSPADHVAFVEILRAIGPDGASRQDVLDQTAKVWSGWTENEVSTNSAGYIARTREWGLVEQKQTKGHYHLTTLGIEHMEGSPR